jgi:hypothetical protein
LLNRHLSPVIAASIPPLGWKTDALCRAKQFTFTFVIAESAFICHCETSDLCWVKQSAFTFVIAESTFICHCETNALCWAKQSAFTFVIKESTPLLRWKGEARTNPPFPSFLAAPRPHAIHLFASLAPTFNNSSPGYIF